MFPPDPGLFLGCAALLLALGAWAGNAWAARRARTRLARVRRHGRRGERRAMMLLRRAGFRLVAREVTTEVVVEVDGRRERFPVRADAIVRRFGRRWVVEIKTGAAASVAHRGTRRQLFEYAAAFGCRRLLLVDADRDRIHRVRFPARVRKSAP